MDTLTNQNQQAEGPQNQVKDTKEMTCSCGSRIFEQAISLREVSRLLTNTGREEYIPLAIIVCKNCKKLFERPDGGVQQSPLIT